MCYALNVWVEKAKSDPTANLTAKRRMAWLEGVVVAISALALLIFTCFLFVEAGERIVAGPSAETAVEAVMVFVFASLNLMVDVVQATLMARVLWRKDERSEGDNVNMLSAAAHVLADTLLGLVHSQYLGASRRSCSALLPRPTVQGRWGRL